MWVWVLRILELFTFSKMEKFSLIKRRKVLRRKVRWNLDPWSEMMPVALLTRPRPYSLRVAVKLFLWEAAFCRILVASRPHTVFIAVLVDKPHRKTFSRDTRKNHQLSGSRMIFLIPKSWLEKIWVRCIPRLMPQMLTRTNLPNQEATLTSMPILKEEWVTDSLKSISSNMKTSTSSSPKSATKWPKNKIKTSQPKSTE